MNDHEFTKENLIDRIVASRGEFEAALVRIPEEQMQTPILHDGWSVKDMLGHLAFWEERLVAGFNKLRAGQTPDAITNMDATNAQALADFRELTRDEVRHREHEAYQQILAMLKDATHQELFEPGYFAGANGSAFAAWIPGDTWEHYAEHLPELQAWLNSAA